jgi:membrane-associated protease RseP (regulator of RpoE activity)
MQSDSPANDRQFFSDSTADRKVGSGRGPAGTPRIRRMQLQALLYLLTCLTTFAAGVVGWEPMLLGFDDDMVAKLGQQWPRGLAYMVAVMAVLTAHEAGHFIAAWWHRIPATLPFFLPVPVLLTGTLGAVIGMEGSRANRRQLFDIALSGPIAGLVIALPVMAVGMLFGTPSDSSPFALSPLARWMLATVRPDAAGGIEPNALFMAGWVGLLVTGLNMIPVSQLDGGHVSYAIFGRQSKWVARSVLAGAVVAIAVLGLYNWIAMVVIVMLMGTDHPPIRQDGQPLGLLRTTLGLFALLIPVITFMPQPLLIE